MLILLDRNWPFIEHSESLERPYICFKRTLETWCRSQILQGELVKNTNCLPKAQFGKIYNFEIKNNQMWTF